MRQLTRLLTVVLIFVSFRADAADATWVEVKSPHFTIASDGGEATARTIAWQFEQLGAAIRTVCPWARQNLLLPVLIMAPGDEAGMKTLAPGSWEAPGTSRPTSVGATFMLDRLYLAVRADLSADVNGVGSPYYTAYWGYASNAVQPQVRGELPMWFTRGLPSVLANTTITDAGVELGRSIPSRVRLLQVTVQRLSLRELLAVNRTSPSGTYGNPLFQLFDYESWAFVHFLLMADKGAHRPLLDEFVALLGAGTPIPAAQAKAFANIDALEPAFSAYLERGVFEPAHVTLDAKIKRESFTPRPWTLVDTKAHQALFLTANQRPAEAQALAKEVQTLDPTRPEPFEVEGLLADRIHDERASRPAYEKAIALGSTNLYALGRLANILTMSTEVILRGGADRATLLRAAQLRERLAALNPSQSHNHLALGQLYLLELRQPLDALTPFQRAAELEPTVPDVHYWLAQALWALKLPQEALAEARRGLELANTPMDRSRGQQLVSEYSR